MVSTCICTEYMSFMIANSYIEFKAFFQTIRFFKKWRHVLRHNVKTRIKTSFRMLVLAKYSEGMMTIFTAECMKNMLTLNHVNKDEMKRSRTAFEVTLTSFIKSKRNMMNIYLFFSSRHLFKHIDVCKLKVKWVSSTLQVRKVWNITQNSSKKIGWRNSLPWDEVEWKSFFFFFFFLVCNLFCLVLIRNETFEEKLKKNTTSFFIWFHDNGWVFKECKCSYSDGLHEPKHISVD